MDCPAGTVTTTNGATTCAVCAAGKFSSPSTTVTTGVGAWDAGIACVDCPVGTYSLSRYSKCLDCAKGKSQFKTGQSFCDSCPAGYTSEESTRSSSCVACLPGYYTGSSAVYPCAACAKGQYADEYALSACPKCAAGLYAKSSALSTCTVCAAGQYAENAGQSTCVDCGYGAYAPNAKTCSTCNNQSYTATAQATICLVCGIGQHAPKGQSFCQLCDWGQYRPYTDADEGCRNCPTGWFSGEFGDTCTQCASGQFVLDSSTCGFCPNGTYRWVFDGDAYEEFPTSDYAGEEVVTMHGSDLWVNDDFGCYECKDTHYSHTGAKHCTPCPAGTFGGCGPNNAYACPNASCAGQCPKGHYCETDTDLGVATGFQERYDKPCELGTYIDYEGAQTEDECTTCEADHCEYECEFCQIDGSCPVSEGRCLIEVDGEPTCFEDGDLDREDGCHFCLHETDHYQWDNFTVDTPCDDLNACAYDDVCDGLGNCGGTVYTCNKTERNLEGYPFGTFLCATDIHCVGDGTCEEDDVYSTSHVCRELQDWCDVLEYCDGSSAECPTGSPGVDPTFSTANETVQVFPSFDFTAAQTRFITALVVASNTTFDAEVVGDVMTLLDENQFDPCLDRQYEWFLALVAADDVGTVDCPEFDFAADWVFNSSRGERNVTVDVTDAVSGYGPLQHGKHYILGLRSRSEHRRNVTSEVVCAPSFIVDRTAAVADDAWVAVTETAADECDSVDDHREGVWETSHVRSLETFHVCWNDWLEEESEIVSYSLHLFRDDAGTGAFDTQAAPTVVVPADNRSYTFAGLDLTDGGHYRVQVRALNSANRTSSATSETFIPDVTAPTDAYINVFLNNHKKTYKALWSGYKDDESLIAGFDWCLYVCHKGCVQFEDHIQSSASSYSIFLEADYLENFAHAQWLCLDVMVWNEAGLYSNWTSRGQLWDPDVPDCHESYARDGGLASVDLDHQVSGRQLEVNWDLCVVPNEKSLIRNQTVAFACVALDGEEVFRTFDTVDNATTYFKVVLPDDQESLPAGTVCSVTVTPSNPVGRQTPMVSDGLIIDGTPLELSLIHI